MVDPHKRMLEGKIKKSSKAVSGHLEQLLQNYSDLSSKLNHENLIMSTSLINDYIEKVYETCVKLKSQYNEANSFLSQGQIYSTIIQASFNVLLNQLDLQGCLCDCEVGCVVEAKKFTNGTLYVSEKNVDVAIFIPILLDATEVEPKTRNNPHPEITNFMLFGMENKKYADKTMFTGFSSDVKKFKEHCNSPYFLVVEDNAIHHLLVEWKMPPSSYFCLRQQKSIRKRIGNPINHEILSNCFKSIQEIIKTIDLDNLHLYAEGENGQKIKLPYTRRQFTNS